MKNNGTIIEKSRVDKNLLKKLLTEITKEKIIKSHKTPWVSQ